jgi:alpha-galactosidase
MKPRSTSADACSRENLLPATTATTPRRPRAASTYEGGNEQVRTAIMNAFGYFQTESSHHASEYLPYFRKNPESWWRSTSPSAGTTTRSAPNHDDQGDIDAQLERAQEAELAPSASSTARAS